MHHQHTHDPTVVHRTAPAEPRRELRFWGYLTLTLVLATLIPVTAAVGVNIADSAWFRVLVAIAISAAAALAVVAAAGASVQAAPKAPRRARGTRS